MCRRHPSSARRPARSPPRGDRPRPRRCRDPVDRRQLASAAVRGRRRAGPPGLGYARACCSRSTTSTTPTTPASASCTTSPGRRTTSGCASCSPTDRRPSSRHVGRDPPEPHRPPRRRRDRARPARRPTRPPCWSAATSPNRRPSWSSRSPASAGASRSPSNELARRAANEPQLGAGARRQHDRRDRAGDPRGPAAGRRRRIVVRHRRVRRARPAWSEDEAFDHLDDALGAPDRRTGQHGLPVPARPRPRRAPRRRAAPPAPPHPSRRRRPADRARRIGGSHRPPPPAGRVPPPTPCRTSYAPPRPRRPSVPTATRWRWSTPSARTPPAPTGRRRCRCGATSSTPSAIRWRSSAYREALDGAEAGAVRRLRVRLARCAVDVRRPRDGRSPRSTALETDGGADDADILLVRGKSALLHVRLRGGRRPPSTEAQRLGARRRAQLEGARPRRAPRACWPTSRATGSIACASSCSRTRENPEIANAIFDGYLCPAEYMLYGPTPVRRGHRRGPRPADDRPAQRRAARRGLRLGVDRRGGAAVGRSRAGRRRADRGERSAPRPRIRRPARPTRCSGSPRCAWPRATTSTRCALLQQALPLARASIIAKHLLQRVFGTMILAAADPLEARAIVDRAESTLGWDDACLFCSIMLTVPASIACVRAGDLPDAQRHLAHGRASPRCCGRGRRGRRRSPRPSGAVAEAPRAIS